MARYIDLEELERRIKKHVKPEIPEEKAFVEWCKDECIRQAYAMPTADVVPKSEVATELIDEILEGLQYEIDTEDKLGRNAWDNGDTVGYHIHQYAEERLDTLKIALSIYKKKYTEEALK